MVQDGDDIIAGGDDGARLVRISAGKEPIVLYEFSDATEVTGLTMHDGLIYAVASELQEWER